MTSGHESVATAVHQRLLDLGIAGTRIDAERLRDRFACEEACSGSIIFEAAFLGVPCAMMFHVFDSRDADERQREIENVLRAGAELRARGRATVSSDLILSSLDIVMIAVLPATAPPQGSLTAEFRRVFHRFWQGDIARALTLELKRAS